MKNSTTKTRIFLFCVAIAMFFLKSNLSFAQQNAYWQLGGNNSTTTLPGTCKINAASFVGSTDPAIPFNIKTTQAQPINIFTSNTIRAQFTTGNALTNPAGWSGDGLRIFDPTGGVGNLDIWTSTSNTTHIKMDGSGEIDGQGNHFEVTGHYTGLWLDATPGTLFPGLIPRIIFNRANSSQLCCGVAVGV